VALLHGCACTPTRRRRWNCWGQGLSWLLLLLLPLLLLRTVRNPSLPSPPIPCCCLSCWLARLCTPAEDSRILKTHLAFVAAARPTHTTTLLLMSAMSSLLSAGPCSRAKRRLLLLLLASGRCALCVLIPTGCSVVVPIVIAALGYAQL
jgi:hypothetical protein